MAPLLAAVNCAEAGSMTNWMVMLCLTRDATWEEGEVGFPYWHSEFGRES